MHEIDRTIAAIRSILGSGRRGILVTVVRTEGSTYRRAGARVVVSEDGERHGSISGGCIEADLAERIRPWLESMEPALVVYDSTREDDALFGLGLGCRGVMELLVEPFDAAHTPALLAFRWNGRATVAWATFFTDGRCFRETFEPPRRMRLFGRGLDVEPVRSAAAAAGWEVEIVTSRELPGFEGWDAVVVMTHNLERDAAIVGPALRSTVPYVGLLGSRSRGDDVLASAGLERTPRFFNPIGLDLGAETPEEIAVSIVAEVQRVLNGRSGRSLRELDAPIHERKAEPVPCG